MGWISVDLTEGERRGHRIEGDEVQKQWLCNLMIISLRLCSRVSVLGRAVRGGIAVLVWVWDV